MKTFQSVVALIVFMGLVFLGCSEKSQLPNFNIIFLDIFNYEPFI